MGHRRRLLRRRRRRRRGPLRGGLHRGEPRRRPAREADAGLEGREGDVRPVRPRGEGQPVLPQRGRREVRARDPGGRARGRGEVLLLRRGGGGPRRRRRPRPLRRQRQQPQLPLPQRRARALHGDGALERRRARHERRGPGGDGRRGRRLRRRRPARPVRDELRRGLHGALPQPRALPLQGGLLPDGHRRPDDEAALVGRRVRRLRPRRRPRPVHRERAHLPAGRHDPGLGDHLRAAQPPVRERGRQVPRRDGAGGAGPAGPPLEPRGRDRRHRRRRRPRPRDLQRRRAPDDPAQRLAPPRRLADRGRAGRAARRGRGGRQDLRPGLRARRVVPLRERPALPLRARAGRQGRPTDGHLAERRQDRPDRRRGRQRCVKVARP